MANQYDLRAVANVGFGGLIDGWISSIHAALEDEDKKAKDDPLDHRLVHHLLAAELQELDELQAKLSAAEGDEDEEGGNAAEKDDESGLSEPEIRTLSGDRLHHRPRTGAPRPPPSRPRLLGHRRTGDAGL